MVEYPRKIFLYNRKFSSAIRLVKSVSITGRGNEVTGAILLFGMWLYSGVRNKIRFGSWHITDWADVKEVYKSVPINLMGVVLMLVGFVLIGIAAWQCLAHQSLNELFWPFTL